MSHWAEIDNNNIVTRVLVCNNNDPAGDEGYQWLIDNLGGTWVQTSYNARIRKNYAGIGFTYDAERDAFIPPKPFASWVLDEEICNWKPPVPMPVVEGKLFIWDEDTVAWIENV